MALASASTQDRSNFEQNKVFKVIVIGDSSVGKTSLTYRFCEGHYLEQVEATIGFDFRTREVQIDGESITLQLWDTAGQERFRTSMVRHYYRNSHAIIFVYDVTNRESFVSLKKWGREANDHCLPDVPRILVGNKCDGVAVVPTNEAQIFADLYSMPFFETSAKLDSEHDNIESIFFTLAYKLKNHRPFLMPATPGINVTGAIVEDKTSSTCC